MKIDLHIHSRTCSDGKMEAGEILREARRRKITMISITDHDSVECQESIEAAAGQMGMVYLTGVELNISFSDPDYRGGKTVSLDVLGYGYDAADQRLFDKTLQLKAFRRSRAEKILERINTEFTREGRPPFTPADMEAIEETVDGSFGRPHIANYMVRKGIVRNRQEAFDRYLVRCDVPKLPLLLEEAAELVHGAGGRLVLAHPNDPNGTSLSALTKDVREQHEIIRRRLLPFLDGVECWHSRHDPMTTAAYLAFARREGLMVTGGSDCHQDPVVMGNIPVPLYVADQFGVHLERGVA
ncbi:PHP domain-containing protein [Desulfatiglans anilini]|uniref:PHP domain-containing protein n=1 Tax=Desulfatiglans anilini TaxID=90728 RepID=UPI000401D556|nr:PHP domain-containing protein [Desulfatiglans anilini]